MRKRIRIVTVLLAVTVAARADVVFMLGGAKAEGDALSVSKDAIVLIDKKGSEQTIKMQRVQRADFTAKEVSLTIRNKRGEPTVGTAVSLEGRVLTIRDKDGTQKKFPLMNLESVEFVGVGKPFEVISKGGEEVDLSKLLVRGKITVVDFFAEWCGPCRALAPFLEQLPKQDSTVVVRKVDIVNWGTPVCSQYSITSVPNMRVYDAQGRQVGAATSSAQMVKNAIEEAKRKSAPAANGK